MKVKKIDLKDERKKNPNFEPSVPHPHQNIGFEKLSKLFILPIEQYKAGIIIYPTGGGKTHTAVNWICNNILPNKIKVLWLAHTNYLLTQAQESFLKNILIIPNREFINIKTVSSSPSHYNSGDIESTDDVLIATSQTAIANFNISPLDGSGKVTTTPFQNFIESAKESGLFIVLDEAHHAPAYGCRNLLLTLKDQVKKLYLLGLTATPTYTDKRNRGWLPRIFQDWIIDEAKFPELHFNKILAKPIYIEKPTGKELEIDDKIYDKLTREHTDIPDYIIEKLVNDAPRNDYIINEYVTNRQIYGKTIIFVDRWFQCEYFKDKLVQKGIKADVVYTHTDSTPGTSDERNKRTQTENEKTIERFIDNEFDVLINIRMLTEGIDIPDTKSVFITRQTTSSILLTQMIGRALRGEKAGGGKNKTEANIVLFIDNWNRIINWATPSITGETTDETPVRGYYPIEYIAISLMQNLVKQINSGIGYSETPFLKTIPIGWFKIKYEISSSETDTIQRFDEYVVVYEHTLAKFEKYINDVNEKLPENFAKENSSYIEFNSFVDSILNKYFDKNIDDIGNTLKEDIIKIARHIAQEGIVPEFHKFEERDDYNLDQIALELMHKNEFEQQDTLTDLHNEPNSLWKVFYPNYFQFKTTFDGVKNRLYHIHKYGKEHQIDTKQLPQDNSFKRELSEIEKHQVYKRDHYQCLCCGISKVVQKGMKVFLEIDHIRSVKLGGKTTVENSQTLCKYCNITKKIYEINFKDRHVSPLKDEPIEVNLIPRYRIEDIEFTLRRIINYFYYCQAVASIEIGKRSNSKYYDVWQIELYSGNNADWIKKHKNKLIDFLHNVGYEQLTDLIIYAG